MAQHKNQLKMESEDSFVGTNLIEGFSCHHCGGTFSNYRVLRSHIKLTHICELGLYFEDKSLLRNFEDDICDNVPDASHLLELRLHSFELRDQVTDRHTHPCRTVFNVKLYRCTVCDYSSSSTTRLRRHIMFKHTKEKPYKCCLCNYRTAHSNGVKRHVLSHHTLLKPYQCDLCEYRTSESYNLQSHIMTKHTNEKPNQCTWCHYRTVRYGDLQRHIMSKHTHYKPNQCSHCDFKTAHSNALKRHIKTQHQNPYKCTLCTYRGTQFNELQKHIKVVHTCFN